MGGEMRELVYLSRGKLDQFWRDTSTERKRRRIKDVGATAPMGLGGFQVGLTDQTPTAEQPSLADVIARIDSAKDPAPWWSEADVRPGDWVRFEADLSFAILPGSQRMLLFWDPRPGFGQTRLMLHGSPKHLKGVNPDEPSLDAEAMGWSSGTMAAVMARFAQNLGDGSLHEGLERIHGHLDHAYPRDMAARMTGYARVTFNTEVAGYVHGPNYRVVVASPLVVEYARQRRLS
jgi:hypothetical protein